jgi:hypothetical protein
MRKRHRLGKHPVDGVRGSSPVVSSLVEAGSRQTRGLPHRTLCCTTRDPWAAAATEAATMARTGSASATTARGTAAGASRAPAVRLFRRFLPAPSSLLQTTQQRPPTEGRARLSTSTSCCVKWRLIQPNGMIKEAARTYICGKCYGHVVHVHGRHGSLGYLIHTPKTCTRVSLRTEGG